MEATVKHISERKSKKSSKKTNPKLENSSEYFDTKQKQNAIKQMTKSVEKGKQSGGMCPKDKATKANSSSEVLKNKKENMDSDSDLNGEPVLSQREKLNISQSSANIDSSSESDFEEVGDGPSTSTSVNKQPVQPNIDLSKLSQEDFNISMLAKFEGVNLEPTVEQDSDDSDWEEVKGIFYLYRFRMLIHSKCV